MQIRREQGGDIPHIYELHRVAFDSLTEPNLVDALREGAPDVISLVAEDAGAVIGHVLFSPVVLAGAGPIHAVGLAPMAVAPTRQRTGIGSALVRAGIAACRERHADAIFVVGHPGYYPRFGFTQAARFGISCEFAVPAEAFMCLELVDGALRDKTGEVRFHAAFRAS